MDNKVNILPEELELASKVASKFARKWRLVNVDDVEAHLFLWLVENYEYVKKYRDDDNNARLYVSLRREAARYCAKETKHVANIDSINNNNFYNIDMIYRALPFLFEYNPLEALMSNEYESLAQTIMSDINGVYHGLPSDVKQVIALRYRDGLTFEQIGEFFNITSIAAEKRVERAVHKLYDSLAGTPVQWYKNNIDKKSYDQF